MTVVTLTINDWHYLSQPRQILSRILSVWLMLWRSDIFQHKILFAHLSLHSAQSLLHQHHLSKKKKKRKKMINKRTRKDLKRNILCFKSPMSSFACSQLAFCSETQKQMGKGGFDTRLLLPDAGNAENKENSA